MYRVAWPLTPSSTGYTNPQIWFQDMSCNWFVIAGTFTAYFRLMMVIYSPPAYRRALLWGASDSAAPEEAMPLVPTDASRRASVALCFH
jgi:hypothetical protein